MCQKIRGNQQKKTSKATAASHSKLATWWIKRKKASWCFQKISKDKGISSAKCGIPHLDVSFFSGDEGAEGEPARNCVSACEASIPVRALKKYSDDEKHKITVGISGYWRNWICATKWIKKKKKKINKNKNNNNYNNKI